MRWHERLKSAIDNLGRALVLWTAIGIVSGSGIVTILVGAAVRLSGVEMVALGVCVLLLGIAALGIWLSKRTPGFPRLDIVPVAISMSYSTPGNDSQYAEVSGNVFMGVHTGIYSVEVVNATLEGCRAQGNTEQVDSQAFIRLNGPVSGDVVVQPGETVQARVSARIKGLGDLSGRPSIHAVLVVQDQRGRVHRARVEFLHQLTWIERFQA